MTKIYEVLKQENGLRRKRTLTVSQIAEVVREAIKDEYAWASGGEVANAYGYPAVQTVAIAAIRKDGKVALAIGTANANKGACPRPWNVPIPRLRPDGPVVRRYCSEWAEKPVGGFVVSRRAARKFIKEAA